MPKIGQYVDTKTKLAQRLGIRYATLLEYFNIPGHPANRSFGDGRYDVSGWHDWIRERKQAKLFTIVDGKQLVQPNARELALIERNQIAAEAARFDLSIKQGEYVARINANRDVDTANTICIRELTKLMQHTLPIKLVGLTPGEIAKVAMEELNRVLRYMPGHFKRAADGSNGTNGS